MFNTDALQQLRQLKTEIKSSKVVYPGTIKLSGSRFGFITLDDGREVYLPQEQAQRVLPGDRIEVTLIDDDKGKPLAEVENLLEKTAPRFVGQYQIRGSAHFVAPDLPGLNRWLFVPPKFRKDAKPGDYVTAHLSQHPFKSGNGQASIDAVIGSPNEAGIERKVTLARHEVVEDWPAPALAETEALTEADIERIAADRDDLSHLPFVTIDAPSTQDMDDALMAEQTADGWRLHVAIADPSALLAPEGAAEACARERVSSGYLPGGVRPMLPETLSNHLCSLRPGVKRLALVCEVDIAGDGALGDYRFREAVIESKAKLSYDSVAEFLTGHLDETVKPLPDPVITSLYQLGELTQVLRQWRTEHALVSEDRPDYRLRLDEKGKIRTIEKVWPTEAHKLVEECMVAANRCAAGFLREHGETGLYIVHRGIREEKVEQVKTLLEAAGEPWRSLDPASPDGFGTLLRSRETIGDDPVRAIVMRQLERAEISLTPAPHQGMGLLAYTTFTSPLRKYSDFFVHRLIRQHLHQAAPPRLENEALAQLQQGQLRLRRAVAETEQWLKCQFAQALSKSMGNARLKGQIVRVASAGFQVRLDDTGLEGFVATRDLEGKYSFNPTRLTLSGKLGVFRLEQQVEVAFKEVEMERRQIRFRLLPLENAEA